MALMGFHREFEAVHGSRDPRSDTYTIEVAIAGPIDNGFVAGVDYVQPIKRLDQLAEELENNYLDDIVGRATNENIAQYLLFRLSDLPIHRIRVTEGGNQYVEMLSDEFDADKYPAQLAYNKGHSHLLREQPEAAIAHFNDALDLDDCFVAAYNLRGRCLKYLKKYDEALLDFQKASQLNPDFGEAWRNIGNAYLYLDKYDEMIPAFNKAVELMPNSALAINNRGYGYFVQGDFSLALQDHLKAIEIDPNYAEAHFDKAEALKALGEDKLAEAAMLESERLKHSGEDTFHGINMY